MVSLVGKRGFEVDQSGDFIRQASVGSTGNWALLIDGENVGACFASQVLSVHPEAFAIRHVFGNLTALGGWEDQPALRVIHTPEGRNSADILLAIEAIKLAAGGVRDFVIVTADGGLAHLVRHLREVGCRVVLMADKRASALLRHAGHAFVELTAPTPPAVKPVNADEVPTLSGKGLLKDVVLAKVREAGAAGMLISDLNPLVRRELGVNISAEPEKTWRAWLTAPARKGRYHCDPKGPTARVRVAPPTP